MSGRRPVSPNVLVASGITERPVASPSQTDVCSLCATKLRFNTDALTRLIEWCDTPSCPNHRWHLVRPIEDLIDEPPPRSRKPRVMGAAKRRRA